MQAVPEVKDLGAPTQITAPRTNSYLRKTCVRIAEGVLMIDGARDVRVTSALKTIAR